MRRLLSILLILTTLSGVAAPAAYAQAAAAGGSAAPAGRAASGGAAAGTAGVASLPIPFVDLNVRTARNNQEVVLSVQLLLLLTVLAIAPSILILTTCFLRIAIVFDFIRRALSLQSSPPNQVMMGLALFLTLFIMWPTFNDIYQNSLKPFGDGKIGLDQMFSTAEKPLRIFMFRQMGNDVGSIQLFMSMRGLDKPRTLADVPTYVLIPAFVIHEMTTAFKIGILLYIPFIIIDLVVASTLMSMGMIMLPPVMISTPFKLILFVLVDGWGLLTMQLVRSFR
ncbi:MAG TPA: flagellar type III secretion system pore protein FliP [Spirochaetia bacterium]|nr:flagellar type III secretion system pore protein FliP [Spirochaetia bacterium]